MKNNADVFIDGKIYTVCGAESEAYFQKVASYIDQKIEECEQIKSYRYQDARTRSVLLALNIADDYHKAQNKITALEKKVEESENRIYEIKRDLIGLQMKYEETMKALIDADEKIAKTDKETNSQEEA